jgi:hypothetical protein
MSVFPKSSPNLDALVGSAVRYEDIMQLCKNEMEQRGLMPDATPAAPPAPTAVVDNEWGCTRVFYIGNSRFEINASSEAALDDQESRIRGAFGQQETNPKW